MNLFSINVPIHYWQPYLSVLYGSFLLAGGCVGCARNRLCSKHITHAIAFWELPTDSGSNVCSSGQWHL